MTNSEDAWTGSDAGEPATADDWGRGDAGGEQSFLARYAMPIVAVAVVLFGLSVVGSGPLTAGFIIGAAGMATAVAVGVVFVAAKIRSSVA
jgi:hypothetical protein